MTDIVLLIDGTNLYIRNFSIVPTLDLNGNPNGGILGMLLSLRKIMNLVKPSKVVIAWDGAGGSKKRRTINKAYKEGRKPTRLKRNFEFELVDVEKNKVFQRLRLADYLSDLPINEVIVDDIEADDTIGYLCKFYDKSRVVIASSDKDFYQLLNDKIIFYSTSRKIFLTSKNIFDEYKIAPINFALARAITGDKSDNLPGVKGIGFAKLIKAFPIFSLSNKIDIDEWFTICNTDLQKYKIFLDNEQTIRDNYKIMRLDSNLIGFSSIQKIQEQTLATNKLNATNFRIKLLEDGITKMPDDYLHSFKILEEQLNG